MKTTLGELRYEIRRLLREFGVDDDLRNSAGFFMAGGVNGDSSIGRADSIMNPPPGLGDDEYTEDNEDNDEQEKGQAGARVSDRAGGETGSSRAGRKGRGGPTGDALPGQVQRW